MSHSEGEGHEKKAPPLMSKQSHARIKSEIEKLRVKKDVDEHHEHLSRLHAERNKADKSVSTASSSASWGFGSGSGGSASKLNAKKSIRKSVRKSRKTQDGIPIDGDLKRKSARRSKLKARRHSDSDDGDNNGKPPEEEDDEEAHTKAIKAWLNSNPDADIAALHAFNDEYTQEDNSQINHQDDINLNNMDPQIPPLQQPLQNNENKMPDDDMQLQVQLNLPEKLFKKSVSLNLQPISQTINENEFPLEASQIQEPSTTQIIGQRLKSKKSIVPLPVYEVGAIISESIIPEDIPYGRKSREGEISQPLEAQFRSSVSRSKKLEEKNGENKMRIIIPSTASIKLAKKNSKLKAKKIEKISKKKKEKYISEDEESFDDEEESSDAHSSDEEKPNKKDIKKKMKKAQKKQKNMMKAYMKQMQQQQMMMMPMMGGMAQQSYFPQQPYPPQSYYPPQGQGQYYQPPPQQQGHLAMVPMKSMAFDAPHVSLSHDSSKSKGSHHSSGQSTNYEDEGDDEDEEGEDEALEDNDLEFFYEPQGNDRMTQVTFTVEPKRQPWLTMMKCGFRPVVNCTAPPCYLTPNNNPGIKVEGGRRADIIKNAFNRPYGYPPPYAGYGAGGYPNAGPLPTLKKLKNSLKYKSIAQSSSSSDSIGGRKSRALSKKASAFGVESQYDGPEQQILNLKKKKHKSKSGSSMSSFGLAASTDSD